jgi:ATP-dependent DNA ligase
LIELNGDDLRRDPLEVRKATLASILAKARPGIRFNEHIEGDGPTVFAHACKMGLEGIVSKRKDSAYRSGRSPDWLKMKNPACTAVKRSGGTGGQARSGGGVGVINMDRWAPELFLISLLAAFCGGLAWTHDHEMFAAAFAAAAVVAASQARPR